MAFAPPLLHHAEVLSLPGSVVLASSLCRAARWAAASRNAVRREEWRLFDVALQSEHAALAVLADSPYPRAWHAHRSIAAQLREEHEDMQAFVRAHTLGDMPVQRMLVNAMRPPEAERERLVTEVLQRQCVRWAHESDVLVAPVFRFAKSVAHCAIRMVHLFSSLAGVAFVRHLP